MAGGAGSRIVVYEWCNETVAHLGGVSRHLAAEARKGATRARAKLRQHRDTGDSTIEVSHGTVDSFISLDDTRGAQAAGIINIETGALDAAF